MALKNTISEPTTLRCIVWGVESRERNQDRRKSKSQGGGQRTGCQLCCRSKASRAAGQGPVGGGSEGRVEPADGKTLEERKEEELHGRL